MSLPLDSEYIDRTFCLSNGNEIENLLNFVYKTTNKSRKKLSILINFMLIFF